LWQRQMRAHQLLHPRPLLLLLLLLLHLFLLLLPLLHPFLLLLPPPQLCILVPLQLPLHML